MGELRDSGERVFGNNIYCIDPLSHGFAAPALPEGEPLTCHRICNKPNVVLHTRVVVGADPYNEEMRYPRTRRGDHRSSAQALTANGIWCAKQTKRRQPKPSPAGEGGSRKADG